MQRHLTWAVCGLVLLAAVPARADEVFSLGEVIVTGEQQVVNLATTVTEVTAEDIKERGARTLADALGQLPGVYVQRGARRGESNVSIRGFGHENVKVLVDGVPIYEQYSRSIDLSQFPVDNIAKITVTKGASSVLYGSNTMGGVINIITKVASKPTVNLTTAWGDYNTEQYSLSGGAPFGDFNAWLGYTYRHSDGWKLSDDFDPSWWTASNGTAEDDGGRRRNSDYLQHHFNAKLGYEPNKDTKLYLLFDFVDAEKGMPTRADWRFPAWQQWQLSLVGEHQVLDWLRLKARGFYVNHDDTLFLTFGRLPTPQLSEYDNYSVGGELQAFMDFGRWSRAGWSVPTR